MLWLMLWLTCTAGGCYEERIEQEFYSYQECQNTLAFYQLHQGVVGVCYEDPDGT